MPGLKVKGIFSKRKKSFKITFPFLHAAPQVNEIGKTLLLQLLNGYLAADAFAAINNNRLVFRNIALPCPALRPAE